VKRGEIWIANLNPSRGREFGKVRPVLIVNADELIDAGAPVIVVLPVTTQVCAMACNYCA
jgi:mRNA interferase MazF